MQFLIVRRITITETLKIEAKTGHDAIVMAEDDDGDFITLNETETGYEVVEIHEIKN